MSAILVELSKDSKLCVEFKEQLHSVGGDHYWAAVNPRSILSTLLKGFVESDLSAAEQIIFEKLRWWRMETARKYNVPAYLILHDATMREIAKAQPGSLDDLRGVIGVGEKKLETYGADIVALIAEM